MLRPRCRNTESSTEGLASKDLPPNTAPFMPNIFYENQFRAKPVYPPDTTDLSGRTAIVTGANSGLGLECCRQLLSYGLSQVILAVRSQAKGDKAAASLQSAYPNATIQVWLLDMGAYSSIQAFAKRVDAELPRVDYVVLNAGVMQGWSVVPSTGHEEMIQVNYLSQALLTLLLLPILKAKAKASPGAEPTRLTWLNSALSLIAKFPERNSEPMLAAFDVKPTSFEATERYNTSKLLAQFFLWKLSEFVSADDVVVSTVDPGYTSGTSLGLDTKEDIIQKGGFALGWLIRSGMGLFEKTARSVEVGTSTIVDALLNHGKESHGSYLMSWKIAP